MELSERHVLYIDEYEQAKDKSRLTGGHLGAGVNIQTGQNIFYFSYGNDSYQLGLVKDIAHGVGIANRRNIYCFDASDKKGIQSTIHSITSASARQQSNPDPEMRLFILHNVDKLTEKNVQNLDLLFPLYEKTSTIKGMTILLTASSLTSRCSSDIQTCPSSTFPTPTPQQTLGNWKEHLVTHFHHPQKAFFNGNAFISRITRFAVQDPTQALSFQIGQDEDEVGESADEEIRQMNEQFCDWLPSMYDMLLPPEALPPPSTDKLLTLDSSMILALTSIVVICYYILRYIQRKAASGVSTITTAPVTTVVKDTTVSTTVTHRTIPVETTRTLEIVQEEKTVEHTRRVEEQSQPVPPVVFVVEERVVHTQPISMTTTLMSEYEKKRLQQKVGEDEEQKEDVSREEGNSSSMYTETLITTTGTEHTTMTENTMTEHTVTEHMMTAHRGGAEEEEHHVVLAPSSYEDSSMKTPESKKKRGRPPRKSSDPSPAGTAQTTGGGGGAAATTTTTPSPSGGSKGGIVTRSRSKVQQ